MACAGDGFFLVLVYAGIRPVFQVINQMVQLLFTHFGQMRCTHNLMPFVIALTPCSNTHEIDGIEILEVQHSFIHIAIGGHNRAHQFIAAIMHVR